MLALILCDKRLDKIKPTEKCNKPYTVTAKIGSSGKGFHATYWTISPNSQTLIHLQVSTSHKRTVPSLEPIREHENIRSTSKDKFDV
jgi:hypothetical protein